MTKSEMIKEDRARTQLRATIREALRFDTEETLVMPMAKWISAGRGKDRIRFYLRRTWRLLNGAKRPTIDLASAEARVHGRGNLKRALEVIEGIARETGHCVYLENVLGPYADRLTAFYTGRGYEIVNKDDAWWPCFYRDFGAVDTPEKVIADSRPPG